MSKESDQESAPLISSGSHVRFYTSDDVISGDNNEANSENGERSRRPSCRSWISGPESDAEVLIN